MKNNRSNKFGHLCDYKTGRYICPASRAELRASKRAAKSDGGAGTIRIKINRVYVWCFVS